jgi:hypothetical protein
MPPSSLSRRQLLQAALPLAGALWTQGYGRAAEAELPPVRPVTKGPKFHWFGYYDKLQFDPSQRYLLGMQVDFEHRSPKPEDEIRVGVIDLENGDHWTQLGTSRAWCWQQGCMLQWVPGSKATVLWNDREDDRFVCHVLDVKTKKKRTLATPVYTLSPDGKSALTIDFGRLHATRPGYGYAGVPDAHPEPAPKESGVWKVDLDSGKRTLLFSLADATTFGPPLEDAKGAKHWFNHLLYNTDGSRFSFLHRWKPASGKPAFRTRLITLSAEGKDPYLLDPSGFTSHYIWRDPKHLLAWTRPQGQKDGFYLFQDKTTEIEAIGRGIMTVNGHCTYLPGNEWILNDTYPDAKRNQNPYLFHVKTGKRVALGHFASPKEYTGEWRCDTHPRFSPDGTKIVIDSPHQDGRQMYLMDVTAIVRG